MLKYDFESSVFELMLKFMYTENEEILKENDMQLFEMSDYFGYDDLKVTFILNFHNSHSRHVVSRT